MLRTTATRALRSLSRLPQQSTSRRLASTTTLDGDEHAGSIAAAADEAFERFEGIPKFQRYPHAFPVTMTLHEYQRKYERLEAKARVTDEPVNVAGRIVSIRAASKKLVFLDLQSDGKRIQVLSELKHFEGRSGSTDEAAIHEEFQTIHDSLRRGDIIGECL